MRYKIKHSIDGRIRFQIGNRALTAEQEDILEQYLLSKDGIEQVKVYGRTASVAIWYSLDKAIVLTIMKEYEYQMAKEQFQLRNSSTNAIN